MRCWKWAIKQSNGVNTDEAIESLHVNGVSAWKTSPFLYKQIKEDMSIVKLNIIL